MIFGCNGRGEEGEQDGVAHVLQKWAVVGKQDLGDELGEVGRGMSLPLVKHGADPADGELDAGLTKDDRSQ